MVKKKTDKKKEETEKQTEKNTVLPFVIPPDVFSGLPAFLLSHIFGVLLIYLPHPATVYGDKFDLGHEDAVGLAFAAFVLVNLKHIKKYSAVK